MSRSVFVAGHNGMVGSALCRSLLSYNPGINLVLAERSELDLFDARAVKEFVAASAIDQIYIAAARVGGIKANSSYPVEFLVENLSIQNNLITAAHDADIDQLMFLGSSCIYPKHAEQPIAEESLLSGRLEPSNSAYAIAKIAGLELCKSYCTEFGRDYRSVMPTNLYGQGDNFHPENSHVIPGLIARFAEAKALQSDKVTVWGTGRPLRDFLHVDDLADACVYLMEMVKPEYEKILGDGVFHINIGSGEELSIQALCALVANVVGFDGEIVFDSDKPDGTPRKRLDINRLNKTGWRRKIELQKGLQSTYEWYLNNREELRMT